MSNIVKAHFGVAAILAGTLGLGGCSDSDSPYEVSKDPAGQDRTGFSATLIQPGSFSLLSPRRGAYRLDVPAESFGGKPGTKIPCLLLNEWDSGAISCDWSKLKPADGPQ